MYHSEKDYSMNFDAIIVPICSDSFFVFRLRWILLGHNQTYDVMHNNLLYPVWFTCYRSCK